MKIADGEWSCYGGSPGGLRIRVRIIKLFVIALFAVRWSTPRRTALRMIEWYQVNVSDGRNLCSRPAPYNCSNRAAWFITSYGVLVGGLLTFIVMGENHDH